MARVLVVTVACEGGLYSLNKRHDAPIRIFSDRWVEDDIIVKHGFPVKRERLSKKEYRRVRNAAKKNYVEGRI
jgi:hypothetical protein